MDAKAATALAHLDTSPTAARVVADQGQQGQFQALLAAPIHAAEHRASSAHARDGHGASSAKASATADGTATEANAANTAAPPPPAPKTDAATTSATTPASPASSIGTLPAPTALPSPIVAPAALDAATIDLPNAPAPNAGVAAPVVAPTAPVAAPTVAIVPPTAVIVAPTAVTVAPTAAILTPTATTVAPTAATVVPTTAAASSDAAAAAPTGAAAPSLAATLGQRLVAGAPTVAQPPRTPLASLTQAQDKAGPAAPPLANHSAATLDLLQGSSKPAVDTTDANAKLLDATAKGTVAPQAVLEHVEPAPVAAEQPTEPRSAASSDALAAQIAAAPATATPATPPTGAASTLPLMAHAAAEQVAIGLRQAVKNGVDHIEIQLQPAELGGIAVKLNVNHDGRVTMVVSADRSDTLNLLRQDAGTLAQALRDAGLQADNSSLSFNLRGFHFNQQAWQGGAPWRDSAPSGSGDDLGDATLLSPSLRRHSGALDIHV